MAEDRRITRTKLLIKQSFLQLLDKKNLDEISIKEITDGAMCNRNTFYLHYTDKYDLMNRLCKDALETTSSELNKLYNRSYSSYEDMYLIVPRKCLELMEKDFEFYRIVLGKNRYPQFYEKYKETMVNLSLHSIPANQRNSKKKRLEIEYATHGLIGIHKYWLLNHEHISKEEILTLSKDLILSMGKLMHEK